MQLYLFFMYRNEDDLRRSIIRAKFVDPARSSRSESPDTQLGESLLDPPHSLSRIPRRYQSPSRSGSPSLETPEHIMCRVRTPGPNPGRPPEVTPSTFCTQPQLIQHLNPFAWTQARYPSFSHQQCSFTTSHQEATSYEQYPSCPSVSFTAPISSSSSYSRSENVSYLWPEMASYTHNSTSYRFLPDERYKPPQETLPYQLYQNLPTSRLPSAPVFYESNNNNDNGIQQPWSSEQNFNEPASFISGSCAAISTASSSIGAATTTNTNNINVRSPSSSSSTCPLHINIDSQELMMKNEGMPFSSSPHHSAESPQGMKRKGAYAKESPRNKRESPPHVYYSKEGKGELDFDNETATLRSSPSECDDLLKRKSLDDEDEEATLFSVVKKNAQRKVEIVNDRLWPSCSQAGKHFCSSVEDLTEEVAKAEAQSPVKKVGLISI